MRKWMAILLCLAMLAGLCGCGAGETAQTMQTVEGTEAAQAEPETTAETESEEAESVSSRALIGGAAELVPEYARVDVDAIVADCDRLATCTDGDEVVALYDALYERFCSLVTTYAVAELCNSMDVTDEYWADELVWSISAYSTVYDALCTACCDVLQGSGGAALREHIGDEAADALLAYVETDAYELELFERESELCNEYILLDNEVRTTPVEIDGESWTYEMLYSAEGDELYYSDYDRYKQVEQAVLRKINEQLGEIYVELVALRQEMAAQAGYDSYVDYEYEAYGRAYDGEQAQRFCDAVKAVACERSYYSDIYYTDIGLDYDFDPIEPEELIALLGEYAAEIDPIVYDGWEYMTENGLYALPTGDVCDTGGYTIALPSGGAPYIYDYITGDAVYDFEGLSHEFGHFLNFRLAPSPNELACVADYDVSEIHSNGLEMLYAAFYGDIYGDGARTATCNLLLEQLDSVVNGCIYDEFQRRVYATENITLDDVNRIYGELCVEYGEYDEVGEDYQWMFVHHNFDQPLYYISYAASALVALQIWELSQTDYDAAVRLWVDIVHEGGYTRGYTDVVAESGLSGFADEGAVAEVLASAMDYLLENG